MEQVSHAVGEAAATHTNPHKGAHHHAKPAPTRPHPHHGTVRCQFLRFARIPEVLASKKRNTTCSQAKTQYIILGGPSLAFQFPMTAETSILHLGHVHRIKSIFLHIVLHHFLWLMSWREFFSHAGGAGTSANTTTHRPCTTTCRHKIVSE